MTFIPVFKPLLEDEEKRAVVSAIELGWLGMGSFVGEFEDAVRGVAGAEDRHVVAVSTGHAAIHLALLAAGIGPGDEVITPSFNNVADLQAILATGARPVFCDIEPDTLCIDLAKAEEVVGPRTRAMIVMDYFCHLCDHDAVAAFAQRHGVRVIHDAAHSFGSVYKGRPVGSFSDITMFSFDPVKTVTCIDGGALVVRSEEEDRAIREMRLVGMGQPWTVMYKNERAWTYDVSQLGFRYHMANLHAAVGLSQIAKLDRIIASRRQACLRYSERLRDVAGLIAPGGSFEGIAPFLYYVRLPADRRDAFRAELKEHGVDTGIHWQPGHWFTLFKDCRSGDLTVTEKVGREIVSLPLHSMMRLDTVDEICDRIVAVMAGNL